MFLPKDNASNVYPKLCQSTTNAARLHELAHLTAISVGTEGGFCRHNPVNEPSENFAKRLKCTKIVPEPRKCQVLVLWQEVNEPKLRLFYIPKKKERKKQMIMILNTFKKFMSRS